jgi:hypothetical protein
MVTRQDKPDTLAKIISVGKRLVTGSDPLWSAQLVSSFIAFDDG